MDKPHLAIVQPFIPHYRAEFFRLLGGKVSTELFCYDQQSMKKGGFSKADSLTQQLNKITVGPFLWFRIRPLLKKEFTHLVLMLDFKHLSTWVLLFSKPFHKKTIILLGHGISVKRYLKEEKNVSVLLKWMLRLCNIVWFYTFKEQNLWEKQLPGLNSIALNNTISDTQKILDNSYQYSKDELKQKYGISQSMCFIFSARFNELRRVDLLIQIIKILNPEEFAFIIVGDGPSKPEFSGYKNVYDFGAIYDFDKKKELFQMADIYLQPAWVGLSIVEAMFYSLPIFTFSRAPNLYQCVEFAYIKSGENGIIFKNLEDFFKFMQELNIDLVKQLGIGAYNYATKNLKMSTMVNHALSTIKVKK